jgi:hypothetical protein
MIVLGKDACGTDRVGEKLATDAKKSPMDSDLTGRV